jgi:hypothetical protein
MTTKRLFTVGITFGLLCLGLVFARSACAQEKASTSAYWDGLTLVLSDTWTCSPVAALSGYQLNLATEKFQEGVSFGGGVGCRYTGLAVPLSVEAVGSFAANTNAPNATQGSFIFVVADNFGAGPGMQVFKDSVSGDYTKQFLISIYLTGSWASTIEQLQKSKAKAVREDRVAAARMAQEPAQP